MTIFKETEILIDFIQEMDKNMGLDDFLSSSLNLICDYFNFSFSSLLFREFNLEENIELQVKNGYMSRILSHIIPSIADLLIISQHYNSVLMKNNHLILSVDDENLPLQITQILEEYNINILLLIPLNYRNNYFGNLICQPQNCQETLSEEIIKILKAIGIQYGIFLDRINFKNQLKKQEEFNTNLQIKSSKNEYLLQMNHELRTPMTAIIGFAKMLKQEIYGELNPKQWQYVKAIYEAGVYLLELINDLLDITKLDAEKEQIFIEKIVIEEICNSCLSLVQEKANEQKTTLNLEINNNIDFCFGDPRKIKQILVNLLSNAVKFTEQGSVILKVEKKLKHIEFSVIDTGIGINEIDQKKLFKPFLQLKTNLHKQHKGSGLGLALSLKLAELHGGEITLNSEVGKGSCFTFHLPLSINYLH